MTFNLSISLILVVATERNRFKINRGEWPYFLFEGWMEQVVEINFEFKTESEAVECKSIIEAMMTDEGVEVFDNILVITDMCHNVDMAREICIKHFGKELKVVEKRKID